MMPTDFSGRLERGAFWEAWVGAVLSRAGMYTTHLPSHIDRNKDFSESWDLEVQHCDSGSLTPVLSEVKSLSLPFHNVDDYPFETVLVCAQDSWTKKWPGKDTVQRDFLLVSNVTGSILWIPTGTKVQLGHPVHDRNRNYSYKCAVVNKSQLRPFADFVDMLRSGEHVTQA